MFFSDLRVEVGPQMPSLGVQSKTPADKLIKFDDICDVSRLTCDTVSRSNNCERVKNIDHGRGKRCCVGRSWGTCSCGEYFQAHSNQ